MHQNWGQAEVATGKQRNLVAARGVPGIFVHPPRPFYPSCHDYSGRELLKIDFLVPDGNSTGDPALGGRSPVCGA